MNLNSSNYVNGKPVRRQSDSGQIIVEYVLLLVVAVSMAVMITRMVISRNPDNPGFIISAWEKMIEQIGVDQADDAGQAE